MSTTTTTPEGAMPCTIAEADFVANTITLEMTAGYTVAAGQYYLISEADMRAALAAALAVQPRSEPVAWRPAWVEPSPTRNDGLPRQQDIDYYTREGVGIEYAYAAPQPARVPQGWKMVPREPTTQMNQAGYVAYRATGLMPEIWRAMLADAPAAAQPSQPVGLPALPVGAADTFVRFPDNGDRCQYRLSDLLTIYARAALAAAGVTVADEGGANG